MFDYDFRRRMEAAKDAAAVARGRGEASGAHASWRARAPIPEHMIEPLDRVLSYLWQDLRLCVEDLNWQHHINGPMWRTEREQWL